MKVCEEVAKQELDRFADAMGLDINPDGLDENSERDLNSHKNRLIKAIMEGSLVILESGEPSYTTTRDKNPVTITFKEPTGSVLMAADKRKDSEHMARAFAMAAEMTGEHPGTFAKMKTLDAKICISLVTLFLA